MQIRIVYISFLLLVTNAAWSQREIAVRSLAWAGLYADYTAGPWIASLDAQARYEYLDGDWFQWLVRPGITYKTKSGLLPTVGIAFFSLYPNPNGKVPRPELRPWQEIGKKFVFNSGKHTLYPRLRTEQRFIKQYVGDLLADDFTYFNFRTRWRCDYIFRFHPDRIASFYITASEECMFGFFKGGFSAFDQNRIWFGEGYRFNKNVSVQLVYMNLFLQRTANLYEMHHTIRATLNLQLTKKEKSVEPK
jgi:Protein of unknown function (DUF2490)